MLLIFKHDWPLFLYKEDKTRVILLKEDECNIIWFQAYVRHPELAPAKSNRDYAYQQLVDAVNTISGVAQASGASDAHPYEGAGELASALDELMVRTQ